MEIKNKQIKEYIFRELGDVDVVKFEYRYTMYEGLVGVSCKYFDLDGKVHECGLDTGCFKGIDLRDII